jgi:hypothetical protein
VTALSRAAEDYLALRHSLGHKLADAERLLPRFIDWLEPKGSRRSPSRRHWPGRSARTPTRAAPCGRAASRSPGDSQGIWPASTRAPRYLHPA